MTANSISHWRTPPATGNSRPAIRKIMSDVPDVPFARLEILKSVSICQTLSRPNSDRMPSTISIWQCHSNLDTRSNSNYIAGGPVVGRVRGMNWAIPNFSEDEFS
jgi:hypothetical protein